MNKVLILLALMLALPAEHFAQSHKNVTYADKNQINDFYKSKTMVVKDADPMSSFNLEIGDILEKYWTVTPYEMIDDAQFKKLRKNPKYSFIYLSKVQREKDKKKVYYIYLEIVMGADVKDLNSLPVLLSLPIAYTGVDEDSYADKLPLMIRFAQLHIENMKTVKNPKTMNNLKNYSNDSQLLKSMTLLVKESDLSEQVNTVEKIQKDYSGPVKIVSSEEMVKAIADKTPNTAVLHQVSPGEDENEGQSFCQIYGTEDAKLYYYNHVRITERRPAGMLSRDFRLISGKWF